MLFTVTFFGAIVARSHIPFFVLVVRKKIRKDFIYYRESLLSRGTTVRGEKFNQLAELVIEEEENEN